MSYLARVLGTLSAATTITWLGRSKITSPSDGNITMTPNNATTALNNLDLGGATTSIRLSANVANVLTLDTITTGGFSLLKFAGTTSSFPALKRVAAGLSFRLADDTADTTATASAFIASDFTNTAGGTTGAQTISKRAGSVNFAAAATSLVVTNTLVTTASIIMATVETNDTTLKSCQAVPGAGSFTLFANAAATAETRVAFHVVN